MLRLVVAEQAGRMQGFANERGLAPLFDEASPSLMEGGEFVDLAEVQRVPATRTGRLQAARKTLDGISGLGWSVLGFVGGAVFWHFVGFWGFVSDVVLTEDFPPAVQIAGRAAPIEGRSRWVHVADASTPPCTLLVLDRRTGVTSARACDAGPATLPPDSFQGRQDRIVNGDAMRDETD